MLVIEAGVRSAMSSKIAILPGLDKLTNEGRDAGE